MMKSIIFTVLIALSVQVHADKSWKKDSSVVYTDEAIQEDLEKVMPGLSKIQIQCLRDKDADACDKAQLMLSTFKQINRGRKKEADASIILIDALMHSFSKVLIEESKR